MGSPNSATVTIADNELPTVNVLASDATASEPGVNRGRFIITRSGCTNAPLSVLYNLTGTATYGVDYTNKPPQAASVVIPKGKTNLIIVVYPKDDTLPEGPETVTLALSNKPSYLIGSVANATITINDNESVQPSIAAIVSLRTGSPMTQSRGHRNDAADAQKNPAALSVRNQFTETTWVWRIRGADHGIAFVTFHEDRTLTGHGITASSSGLFTVAGD